MSGAIAHSTWNMVSLNEVIRHRKEFIRIDDLQTYKRCRVQVDAKGVVLRDTVYGSEVKTKKQQVCHTGDFLVAEIDAKMGGYGIVPKDLEGAIVSSHYFLYTIDEGKLNRKFLDFFIRTSVFREQVAAQGSTNYAAIRPENVLEYQIPLPPLEKQRRIVRRIEELVAKVEEARGLRSQATARLEAIVQAETTRIFEGLRDCSKVSLGQLGIDNSNPIQTGPFGSQLLRSEFVSAGIPVLNVGNVDPQGLKTDKLDYVLPEKAKTLERYSLKADDLLFARTGATLGKVCLLPRESDGWLMTGHLFRVRLDKDRCDPKFAFVAFRGAESIRSQVFEQVRGATRPGFNTTLLSQVQLPLPSISEQRKIVTYLEELQAKVITLRRLQSQTAAELNALLPSILDKAFKGEL